MNADFLIIGGGIMGLSVARALKKREPSASIILIEKEAQLAQHASGRNSGVLHAGFYYGADSLKAKFCREGNRALHAYCEEFELPINKCGKLVVTCSENDLDGLHELKRRGDVNGVPVELVDVNQARELEPHVRTIEQALFSPHSSVVNPTQVCLHMRDQLVMQGVKIISGTSYLGRKGKAVVTQAGEIVATKIINCAGVNACDIAQDFGFAKNYTILPFKGIYLNYTAGDKPLKRLLYTVPDVRKPFLGVHFAVGVDGNLRIGPTAIPAFWRNHYKGLGGFRLSEFMSIGFWLTALFLRNEYHFREFAFDEMKKYNKHYLVAQAFRMVQGLDASKFSEWGRPGIRAQLFNKKTRFLEQDFVVEGDEATTHVLNAVSPAFTSSLAFADWVVSEFILKR